MKFFETDLHYKEIEELEKQGYKVYQRRDNWGYENDTIEKWVLVNHFSEIVTKENIDFGKDRYINYAQFVRNNEVFSLNDL